MDRRKPECLDGGEFQSVETHGPGLGGSLFRVTGCSRVMAREARPIMSHLGRSGPALAILGLLNQPILGIGEVMGS
jgi:hypothetical protein